MGGWGGIVEDWGWALSAGFPASTTAGSSGVGVEKVSATRNEAGQDI